ncbi:uncharacterized protein Z519_08813 [Cladophialophora bantiana CBS 173.52]|uniref:EKC/KEOPS complex subunit GON7 n=1 Tax=Cladophialophora bantiana (strain ATCC 10958 / CBS 173.52 / CDC B-1940 / NIH 8579) TaxID=1442370 RepID=A0A0D2HHA5_CLAB1|nr:uncharacterized protein Z519_08813 [Cladophialophora bantiana CBS 173.52]KIW90170.1 hypothetical protein Z519_08813 [Cladophialophora bantiana CBS 173.52]
MPDVSDHPHAVLTATYDSPSGSKNFEYTISAPQIKQDGSLDTAAKTEYVSKLRASSRKLQEDINKFLTAKMEEDKERVGQESQSGVLKQKTDELAEENYGEEDEEDET